MQTKRRCKCKRFRNAACQDTKEKLDVVSGHEFFFLIGLSPLGNMMISQLVYLVCATGFFSEVPARALLNVVGKC